MYAVILRYVVEGAVSWERAESFPPLVGLALNTHVREGDTSRVTCRTHLWAPI